jgi:hypothetical protein
VADFRRESARTSPLAAIITKEEEIDMLPDQPPENCSGVDKPVRGVVDDNKDSFLGCAWATGSSL